jgi:LacI family transcriptional regulator
MKKFSLQDISNSLNISKSTISIVLNGRGDEKRVSKDTQEKILKFAKEHNYKANQLARGLSRGKSDMIGLVIPNIADNFYARIARRIELKAEEFGYNVLFSSTGESKERESKLIRSMLDRQVDGLIIASSQKNEEDIKRLKRNSIPFVLVDRHYPNIETNYVIMDNYYGTSSAVERLIKQGRKRIGFISLKPGLEAMKERLDGYSQTLEKHRLPIKANFIQELEYESIEMIMPQIIKKMVQFPCSIDGIVFATHFLAAAGIRELKKLNVRIPIDVAIVSFGQLSAFDLIEPPITFLQLPSNEIGDKAVDILLKNMRGKAAGFEKVCLKADLVVRKSCGKL